MKRHGNTWTIRREISKVQVHHRWDPWFCQLIHPPPNEPAREESKVSPREAHPFGPNRHDAHWKLRQRPSTRGIAKDMSLNGATVPTVAPCGGEQTGVVFQTKFMKDIKRPLGAGSNGKEGARNPQTRDPDADSMTSIDRPCPQGTPQASSCRPSDANRNGCKLMALVGDAALHRRVPLGHPTKNKKVPRTFCPLTMVRISSVRRSNQ